MQLLHHPSLRAGPGRRLCRTLISGALISAGLAGAGCAGGGGSDATILNTEKVERAIEQSSLAQRGQHTQVSCPAGVHQKKGLTFACIAVVGQATTRFSVTQLDGSGRVHYEAP